MTNERDDSKMVPLRNPFWISPLKTVNFTLRSIDRSITPPADQSITAWIDKRVFGRVILNLLLNFGCTINSFVYLSFVSLNMYNMLWMNYSFYEIKHIDFTRWLLVPAYMVGSLCNQRVKYRGFKDKKAWWWNGAKSCCGPTPTFNQIVFRMPVSTPQFSKHA